ncbi:MAG: Holliday junction resolvase RuvX [Fimbriimonadaceae bacterium]|nr:putative pre-16S rRNA nuclease [Fimbriimonadaceae bacterium]MCC6352005.1 Holliday junction resolvase RuvX [Fimbriimonadaceae bacterium]MCL4285031.1 Holliday junction resolvase RuvX [Fimbriimonadaceae bacterium]QOJ10590.1 MAG: Holliday junction resolvase RuvX [Chthonomonadaceae bacterium]
MRVLGVDWGSARIGIAVAETEPFGGTLLPVIAASGSLAKDARRIAEVATSERVEAIVVGVPYNPLGSGNMGRLCRKLAEGLRALGWAVHEVDESFSSQESEDALKEMSLSAPRVRSKIDSAAALRILSRYAHGE